MMEALRKHLGALAPGLPDVSAALRPALAVIASHANSALRADDAVVRGDAADAWQALWWRDVTVVLLRADGARVATTPRTPRPELPQYTVVVQQDASGLYTLLRWTGVLGGGGGGAQARHPFVPFRVDLPRADGQPSEGSGPASLRSDRGAHPPLFLRPRAYGQLLPKLELKVDRMLHTVIVARPSNKTAGTTAGAAAEEHKAAEGVTAAWAARMQRLFQAVVARMQRLYPGTTIGSAPAVPPDDEVVGEDHLLPMFLASFSRPVHVVVNGEEWAAFRPNPYHLQYSALLLERARGEEGVDPRSHVYATMMTAVAGAPTLCPPTRMQLLRELVAHAVTPLGVPVDAGTPGGLTALRAALRLPPAAAGFESKEEVELAAGLARSSRAPILSYRIGCTHEEGIPVLKSVVGGRLAFPDSVPHCVQLDLSLQACVPMPPATAGASRAARVGATLEALAAHEGPVPVLLQSGTLAQWGALKPALARLFHLTAASPAPPAAVVA